MSVSSRIVVVLSVLFILALPAAAGHEKHPRFCAEHPTHEACQHEEPLVLPETLPYPNLFNGGGFLFSATCANDPRAEPVCPEGTAGLDHQSSLEYAGHGMPYLYSDAVEGHHDHAWWVAGDRQGYECVYGFMYDYHPNPFGEPLHPDAKFIARATVVRPEGQSYGKVNDSGMTEAVRYYDGTEYLGGTAEIPDEDCQAVSLTPSFDYDAYVSHGPDDIRVGLFKDNGDVADIRDFTGVQGHFEYVDARLVGGVFRVTVVRIVPDLGVSHVVYYDLLADGRVAVEVNGVIAAEG